MKLTKLTGKFSFVNKSLNVNIIQAHSFTLVITTVSNNTKIKMYLKMI